MMVDPVVLVVDDDPDVRRHVQGIAEPLGLCVAAPASGESAVEAVATLKPDAVVVHVRDGDDSGSLLRHIRDAHPHCHVILTTTSASVHVPVAAIRDGALDCLTVPFDGERLRDTLVTVRKRAERRETLLRLDADVAKQFEFCGMVGRGPAMQELFDAIRRIAPHVRTVVITGETGTGKELVAKALHRLGPRRERRLLTVNCSAVVETLFESELFGHVRGAFTGATETKLGMLEHANGGTVFLDEIGELPLSLQAKLLRAVENGEVQRIGALESRRTDVCVIAATNRDLTAEATAGRFRSDLYYRLAMLELHLVPLRERREDIPYLAASFIRECAERLQRGIVGMTSAAERLLQLAPWPGNVRQLRYVIERACLMSDGRMLTEHELSAALATAGSAERRSSPRPPAEAVHPNRMSTAQRGQIERVLQEVRGNKTAAAEQLGISRRSLYRWLERLDIRA